MESTVWIHPNVVISHTSPEIDNLMIIYHTPIKQYV
jgi:hypothetical protein